MPQYFQNALKYSYTFYNIPLHKINKATGDEFHSNTPPPHTQTTTHQLSSLVLRPIARICSLLVGLLYEHISRGPSFITVDLKLK